MIGLIRHKIPHQFEVFVNYWLTFLLDEICQHIYSAKLTQVFQPLLMV